jgi:hypothetical protein
MIAVMPRRRPESQESSWTGYGASTVFKEFPDLVKMLEGLAISHFSQTIKHALCSEYRRCKHIRLERSKITLAAIMAFSCSEAALWRTAFTGVTKRIERFVSRLASIGRLLLLRLCRQSRCQLTEQILNRWLCGSILQPELRDTVGQARISDIQPNFIQPRPNVLETMAGAQQVLDFRPYLADLSDLGSRFFPHSLAEATDVEVPSNVAHD